MRFKFIRSSFPNTGPAVDSDNRMVSEIYRQVLEKPARPRKSKPDHSINGWILIILATATAALIFAVGIVVGAILSVTR